MGRTTQQFRRLIRLQEPIGEPADIPQTRTIYLASADWDRARRRYPKPEITGNVMLLLIWMVPSSQREDWIEEQRSHVFEKATRSAKIRWLVGAFIGTPYLAYTMHTGREKESA